MPATCCTTISPPQLPRRSNRFSPVERVVLRACPLINHVMRLTPMRWDARRTAKGVVGPTPEPADKGDRALGTNPSGTGSLGRLLCRLACLGEPPKAAPRFAHSAQPAAFAHAIY